ncbi:MAG TPA: hypothetical protein VIG76_12175 [Amnibacterium sp.]|uniref:hypothetical protein n=1 Tax=Amnibacterium sp. TaxID=1872496 RepID=UPI002F924F44
MRFVLALVTFVVAAALIALGVAERTVLRPADHVTLSASAPKDVRYVVVPGSVLTAHPGVQRVHLAGGSTAFAAYGRTSDVTAWLSGQRYAVARVAADGTPLPAVVRTAPVVAGLTGGHPDPNGSDLWLDQARASRSLDWSVNVPDSVSLLVAADGTAPAPAAQVRWSMRVSTPWATPMIVTGSVLALLGLLLYIWALVHLRRRRGPRRKPPQRMPKPPAPPKYRPTRQPAVVASKGRRSVRNFSVLLAGGAASAVLLTGCQGAVAAAPAPTTTVDPASVVAPVAVTEEQGTRIVARAAAVEQRADASLSKSTLSERFGGAALDLRAAAYSIHKGDKKQALPQQIPTAFSMRLILPEATRAWPRTLFAVVSDPADAKAAPLALTLEQQTPRDPYRVEYAQELLKPAGSASDLPKLPSAVLGAARLKPDTQLLSVPPGQLAADYGLLLQQSDAPVGKAFDTAADPLLKAAGQAAKAAVKKGLGSTAKVAFSDGTTDPASVVALVTADSGALVSVQLQETWKVTPTKSDVKVKPSGATRILAGTGSTTKGISSTYGYQLLFSVPPAGSKERIELLGYAQGLISAKEL